jgi:putative tryptophan/tyrosine transport system substrate-binding protein
MGVDMQRREFITLVGGAAAMWPLTARAQRTDRMRTVGMLLGFAEKDPEAINRVKAFQLGMRDLGWIEGRNVQIEYRFAGTDLESINKNVAELVRLAPDVIVAQSTAVMVALRHATSTIPIVFAVVSDPVSQGFISNLAHRGAISPASHSSSPTWSVSGSTYSATLSQICRGWH